jgi:Acyl-CoA dehydrogenase, C-terminal domain
VHTREAVGAAAYDDRSWAGRRRGRGCARPRCWLRSRWSPIWLAVIRPRRRCARACSRHTSAASCAWRRRRSRAPITPPCCALWAAPRPPRCSPVSPGMTWRCAGWATWSIPAFPARRSASYGLSAAARASAAHFRPRACWRACSRWPGQARRPTVKSARDWWRASAFPTRSRRRSSTPLSAGTGVAHRMAYRVSPYRCRPACQAVDLVHGCAGTSGIRNDQRFQQHFRDVHTISQHAFASPGRFESIGKLLLGRESDWPFYYL